MPVNALHVCLQIAVLKYGVTWENIPYAYSEGSDKPEHLHSRIRVSDDNLKQVGSLAI